MSDFDKEAVEKAEEWLLDIASWSLYLWGAVGTHKSGFAAAITKRWRLGFNPGADGVRAAYFTTIDQLAPALLDKEANDWLVRRCNNTQLLVIDDLGGLDAKSSVRADIIKIVRHRYDGKMKMIVTSNLSIDDFGMHIDDRLADRFREGENMFCGKVSKR